MIAVYDFLHGFEFEDENAGKGWYAPSHYYNASSLKENYYYVMEYFYFTDSNSIFKFKIKPSKKKLDISRADSLFVPDPLPNPVIRKESPGYASHDYPVLRKDVKYDFSGNMLVDLFFPLINRSPGRILFWNDFNASSNEYNSLWNFVDDAKPTRAKGTTVWGILFCVGLLIFFKGLRSSAGSNIRKQLLTELSRLDKRKEKILRSINWYKSYENLPINSKHRYDAALSYLEQAQKIIIDFYKYSSIRSSNFFEKMYQISLLLILALLFVVLVHTSVDLMFPDSQNIFTHEIAMGGQPIPISNYYFSSNLETRILNLEISKLRLTTLLIALLIFGIGTIALNYSLSIWKVRQVARSDIIMRLSEYEKRLRNQLGDKTKLLEININELEHKMDEIENMIKESTQNVIFASSNIQNKFEHRYNHTLKDLKKETKQMNRQIKRQIKQSVSDIRKKNASKIS